MLKMSSFVMSIALAGSVIGCVSQEPTGDDDSGGDPDGPGSNPQTQPVCGDHTCSASESHASCPGDCPTITMCGDNVCNGDETVLSCEQDCAKCGDSSCDGNETSSTCPADCAPPSTACTTAPDNCSGDNICVGGSCVSAFNRVYKLFITNGTMPEKNSASASWDPGGGMPDPYVHAFLNGGDLFSTDYQNNTLMPTWNQGATLTVASGAKLQLDVYDDDYDADGYMFSCFSFSMTAGMLRKHGGAYTNTCSASASSTLHYYFVPQ